MTSPPSEPVLTADEIERRAGEERSNVPRGDHEVGTWLRDLVRKRGGVVEVSTFLSWEEADGGSLVIQPDGRFEIRLSPTTSPLRDNFTIAHELGHYLLHYTKRPEILVFNRYGSDRKEREANRFAAALLMPAEEFRTKRRELSDNTTLLASHFGVSEPAVTARMRYITP